MACAFRLLAGLFGFRQGLAGLFAASLGLAGLGFRLGGALLQTAHHAAQGVGKLAHIVRAMYIQPCLRVTGGYSQRIGGDMLDRTGQTNTQQYRKRQQHQQDDPADQAGDGDARVTQIIQRGHGHAGKPHADDFPFGIAGRPVNGAVRLAEDHIFLRGGLSALQNRVQNFRTFQTGSHSAMPIGHNAGHDAGIAFKEGDFQIIDLLEPVDMLRFIERDAQRKGADDLAALLAKGQHRAQQMGDIGEPAEPHRLLSAKGGLDGGLGGLAAAGLLVAITRQHLSLGVADNEDVDPGLTGKFIDQGLDRLTIVLLHGALQGNVFRQREADAAISLGSGRIDGVHIALDALKTVADGLFQRAGHEMDADGNRNDAGQQHGAKETGNHLESQVQAHRDLTLLPEYWR